jgi:hypothetical protein
MNKKIWLLALLGAALGAGIGFFQGRSRQDPLTELFPPDRMKGYVENVNIRIAGNLTSKSITGGEILTAEAVAPTRLDPGKLEPTCLAVLRGLLRQNPDAEWICVFLAEDSALAATSNWLAVAEYQRGKIILRGGHPTAGQMDSLRTLGLSVHRPDAREAALVDAVFAANPGLKTERWKLAQTLRGASPASLDRKAFFRLPLDTRATADVGKKYGKTGEQTRNLVLGVTRYYWLRAGEPWQ